LVSAKLRTARRKTTHGKDRETRERRLSLREVFIGYELGLLGHDLAPHEVLDDATITPSLRSVVQSLIARPSGSLRPTAA
jgi:hypothetical protein